LVQLAEAASSPWIYVGLVLAVLAALLAAAWRRRDNAVLLSAWLFLFCGMILVSLGQLIDFYAVQEEAWSSELLEAAAFVPLLIFALYVAAPMRLLLLSRRREVLFWVLGILIFAGVLLGPVGVFVISLGWLRGREPYPLIGLGLLFSLPADILEHYHLLSHRAQQGQLALLFVLVSQLYFLVGALLAATRRKRAERGS
jgi:MYXO-CTERM domain-containing protein